MKGDVKTFEPLISYYIQELPVFNPPSKRVKIQRFKEQYYQHKDRGCREATTFIGYQSYCKKCPFPECKQKIRDDEKGVKVNGQQTTYR